MVPVLQISISLAVSFPVQLPEGDLRDTHTD